MIGPVRLLVVVASPRLLEIIARRQRRVQASRIGQPTITGKETDMEWRKVAECEGDYLWVSGEPGSEIAVISRDIPTSDQGSHGLAALIAHLDPDEWEWFE